MFDGESAVKAVKEKAEKLFEKIDREIFCVKEIFFENDGIELKNFVSKVIKQEMIAVPLEKIINDLLAQREEDFNFSELIHYWGGFGREPIYFVPVSEVNNLKKHLTFTYGTRKDVGLMEAILYFFEDKEIEGVSPAQFFYYLVNSRESDDALKEFIPCYKKGGILEYRIDKDLFDEFLEVYLIAYFENEHYDEKSANILPPELKNDLEKIKVFTGDHKKPDPLKSVRQEQETTAVFESADDLDGEETMTYLDCFMRMQTAKPDECFSAEEVLNVYLGPPDFSGRDRKINYLKLVLSNQKCFSNHAQFEKKDQNNVGAWVFPKKKIGPLFRMMRDWFKKLPYWGPSEDAKELI